MADRTIPQRELRNNIGEILREAEAGAKFTITVRGRPVARLGPANEDNRRRVNVPAKVVQALLRETQVDAGFAIDLTGVREAEEPIEDPWPGH